MIGFHDGGLSRVLLQCQIGDIRHSPYQPLVVDYLFVFLSLGAHQWENFHIVQLLQAEQLIVVLHLITYAQLIIAVLNMDHDKIHELSEDLLRRHVLLLAVTHQGHK